MLPASTGTITFFNTTKNTPKQHIQIEKINREFSKASSPHVISGEEVLRKNHGEIGCNEYLDSLWTCPF
jgi:hypothetical protein